MRWRGLCDLHLDDELGADVPFELEADAVFEGITVAGSEADDDESTRSRLSRHIGLDDLVQHPLRRRGARYEDGVAMTSAMFEPRID